MATRSQRRPTPSALIAPLIAVLLGLTACGGGPSAEPLPPAPDLLARSATAMAAVQTIALDVAVDPALSTLPIRSASGKLTAAGEAVGTANLNQGGSTVEFQFTVTQGSLYLKGPTGAYQRLPLALAASIYDPTAMLRPDSGVAALLRTATAGETEAAEEVAGVPAYRVRAALDPRVVKSVLPGLRGAATGRVWIDKASSRLLKVQFDVPAVGGQLAPVTVTLSDFDAPVTVTPPS